MGCRAAALKRAGFTLIELLVVIAIIAILASILFPVYSRVRENARRTKCLSNVKQLVMAFTMYADDHDETLPIWCMDYPWKSKDTDGPGNTWDAVLLPYYRNSEMLYCPSNPNAKTHPGLWTGSQNLRSYAMAGYVAGSDTGSYATPEYLSEFPSPTRTVLIFEKGAYPKGYYADAKAEHFFQQGTLRCLASTPDKGGSYEYCNSYTDRVWHTRSKVFGFVDGHAEAHAERSGPFVEDQTSRGKAGYCQNWQDWPEPR
jgi:prepilin-type N-terminal cleavage/methylation domain-containing protein